MTNLYPPHHYGGYELSCRDVVTRWAARGHDVTVLTSDHRVPGVVVPDEPHVHRRLQLYWSDHRIRRPSLRARFALERRNQRALAETIAASRPEVVSFWNLGALSLGLLATVAEGDLPAVLVVCDDWPVYNPDVDAWHRLFRRRPRLARVVRWLTGVPTTLPPPGDAVAACYVSAFTRERAERLGCWAPHRAAVVHSGIERTAFPALAPQPDRPWRWRLLQVGRLDLRKGPATAVRALAHLSDEARLDLVGRGDDQVAGAMAELAERLGVGDRLTITAVDRHELAASYAEADVVVVPGEWDEPFGLVPLEAMACGTPVVATATGGSAEFLVDGVNCLRIRPGDPADLARAVKRLADDAALRRRLVEGGLETAARFDTDRLADVLESWHVAAARRFAPD